MNSNDRKVVFSSGNDEWETPKALYETLDSVFHFTLDPCATNDNHLTPKWFTKDDNGLEKGWDWNTVFVNYPYSDAKRWLEKIGQEWAVSDIVVLCPARTDVKAFHEHVFPKATAITFFNGRLKFLDSGSPKIVVFEHLLRMWKKTGLVPYVNQSELESILSYKYSDLTGDKWTGKFPKKEYVDEMLQSDDDAHHCARELMWSVTTSAPFPSCLIFYCDREKVEEVQGLIDGYTVYLR